MNCSICTKPIEPGRKSYRRVIGWVRDRSGGGVNSIRAAEPTGEYAHETCVDQEASGVRPIPGQLELLA